MHHATNVCGKAGGVLSMMDGSWVFGKSGMGGNDQLVMIGAGVVIESKTEPVASKPEGNLGGRPGEDRSGGLIEEDPTPVLKEGMAWRNGLHLSA